jgi:hypothetical protein
MSYLGHMLAAAGRFSEAEPIAREALELGQQALGEGHPIVASQHRDLGICLARLGEFPAAEDHLLGAHRIIVASFGSDHARTTAARDDLVRFYYSWGKPDRASEYHTGPREQTAR